MWYTIVAPQDYYVGKNTTNGAASTKVCSPVVQYDEADIILVLQPQQHTKSPRAFIAKVCKKLLSQRLFHLPIFPFILYSLYISIYYFRKFTYSSRTRIAISNDVITLIII